ncbi:hypothetical protein CAOG_02614 [Capsaspora owczarzaki ATCC 30864]|nr:hypothetical protein CAOG_02614 [Capsaspora owczarzaki ATCC 30864]|eukprot:XP_004349364.2 hypothetical protein CAOG_02614 [Capsaspora owczarzaki ATCC 30864]
MSAAATTTTAVQASLTELIESIAKQRNLWRATVMQGAMLLSSYANVCQQYAAVTSDTTAANPMMTEPPRGALHTTTTPAADADGRIEQMGLGSAAVRESQSRESAIEHWPEQSSSNMRGGAPLQHFDKLNPRLAEKLIVYTDTLLRALRGSLSTLWEVVEHLERLQHSAERSIAALPLPAAIASSPSEIPPSVQVEWIRAIAHMYSTEFQRKTAVVESLKLDASRNSSEAVIIDAWSVEYHIDERQILNIFQLAGVSTVPQ